MTTTRKKKTKYDVIYKLENIVIFKYFFGISATILSRERNSLLFQYIRKVVLVQLAHPTGLALRGSVESCMHDFFLFIKLSSENDLYVLERGTSMATLQWCSLG